MSDTTGTGGALDRRDFFKTAGAGLTAAGLMLAPGQGAAAQASAEKDRLARIASNSYPIRWIFKTRSTGGRGGAPPAPNPARSPVNGGVSAQQMKQKYGEITMLDFPQFTKDTFPGVTHMDIFSGLFGDVTDDSMFAGRPTLRSVEPVRQEVARPAREQAGEDRHQGAAHLEQRADDLASVPDETLRKAGVEIGKKWLDGCGDPRREVDAHELAAGARPEHPAERDPAIRRRLSAGTSTSCRCSTRRSSRTRRWPITAAISASASRSRTTGGSPPIR